MISVDSSFIAAVDYNQWSGTLVVFMHSGQSYEYHHMPVPVYAGLINAASIGIYYNAYVKGRYP